MSLLFAIVKMVGGYLEQRKTDDEKLAKASTSAQDEQAAKDKVDAINSSRSTKKRTRKSR